MRGTDEHVNRSKNMSTCHSHSPVIITRARKERKASGELPRRSSLRQRGAKAQYAQGIEEELRGGHVSFITVAFIHCVSNVKHSCLVDFGCSQSVLHV